jgi:hypothetical protein
MTDESDARPAPANIRTLDSVHIHPPFMHNHEGRGFESPFEPTGHLGRCPTFSPTKIGGNVAPRRFSSQICL